MLPSRYATTSSSAQTRDLSAEEQGRLIKSQAGTDLAVARDGHQLGSSLQTKHVSEDGKTVRNVTSLESFGADVGIPRAFFVNGKKVSETRFREVFIAAYPRLVEEASDFNGRKIVADHARMFNIKEKTLSDSEMLIAGLQREYNMHIRAGDYKRALKAASLADKARSKSAIIRKMETREQLITDPYVDVKEGEYAYQKLLEGSDYMRILRASGIDDRTVVKDAIFSAMNSYGTALINLAERAQHGTLSNAEIVSAAQRAVYEAVVGDVEPRPYVKSVEIEPIYGPNVKGERTRLRPVEVPQILANPQNLRVMRGDVVDDNGVPVDMGRFREGFPEGDEFDVEKAKAALSGLSAEQLEALGLSKKD